MRSIEVLKVAASRTFESILKQDDAMDELSDLFDKFNLGDSHVSKNCTGKPDSDVENDAPCKALLQDIIACNAETSNHLSHIFFRLENENEGFVTSSSEERDWPLLKDCGIKLKLTNEITDTYDLLLQIWTKFHKRYQQSGARFKQAQLLLRRFVEEMDTFEENEQTLPTEQVSTKKDIAINLMEKMGWKQGEGLGKYGQGRTDPIIPTVKNNRKGLMSSEEKAQQKSISNKKGTQKTNREAKNPVCILKEMAEKKKWNAPEYKLISTDNINLPWLFSVTLNEEEVQPSIGSTGKRLAKQIAAAAWLRHKGLEHYIK